MKRIVIAVGVIAVAVGAARDARAQEQRRGIVELHKHRGFWVSVGGGGGWEDTDFSFATEGRGAAGYLRMGGTVNPRVLFGGEALVWFNDGSRDDVSRVNVTASALLYPSLKGGWFLKPGFGVASYDIGGFDRTGVGMTLGTGFDFRLGRNFYVTPNVDYQIQFFDNATVGTLLFTVGATWH